MIKNRMPNYYTCAQELKNTRKTICIIDKHSWGTSMCWVWVKLLHFCGEMSLDKITNPSERVWNRMCKVVAMKIDWSFLWKRWLKIIYAHPLVLSWIGPAGLLLLPFGNVTFVLRWVSLLISLAMASFGWRPFGAPRFPWPGNRLGSTTDYKN